MNDNLKIPFQVYTISNGTEKLFPVMAAIATGTIHHVFAIGDEEFVIALLKVTCSCSFTDEKKKKSSKHLKRHHQAETEKI